ncbi:hypothetical protein quinque_012628 [Culex quinquefasciatus]
MDLYYHIIPPPSRAVLVLADLLNLEFNLTSIDTRDEQELAVLTKVNPLQSLPTLIDGDIVVGEPHAVLLHLTIRFDSGGTLYPAELRCFVAYAMPVVIKRLAPDQELFEKLLACLAGLEGYLEGREYAACDHFTLADLCLAHTISALDVIKVLLDPKYPNVARWFEKVRGEMPKFDELQGRAEESLDLLAGEQLAPEFVAINPQHCVPTLVDGDVVLWEANAIMVYLAEKYLIPEPGYPTDPVRRALMLQRMFFDVGTLHKAITECYSHQVVTGKQEKSETAVKKLDEVLKLLDGFLAKGKYVAGDTLTLADFSIAGTMSILTLVEHDLSSYEQIIRWQNLCSEKMSGYGGLMDEAEAEWPMFLENLKKKL